MATTTKPSNTKVSSNGHTTSALKSLADSASAKSFWRSAAPKGVTSENAWVAWSTHLRKRRTSKSLEQLCQTASSPLSWGLNLQELSPRTVELLALSDQLSSRTAKGKLRVSAETIEQILGGWLEGVHSHPQSIEYALDCLVVAHALPMITETVLPEFWWSLIDALGKVISSASDWRCDAEFPAEQGLAQQLLAGELPLTLAYLFPEIKPINKLRNSAHEALSEGLAELTNGNGLIQGEYLPVGRPLLACWTRCRVIGDQMKKGAWNRKAQVQYQWAVTHSLGLSSPLGTPILGDPHGDPWHADFLRVAIEVWGDDADALAARSILGKKMVSGIKLKKADAVPETSDNCEWAGLAYMRTDWERSAPSVVVNYSSPDLQLECWTGSQRLLSGTWSWETKLDGKSLEPIGTWDETCWFSDDDVDYLELSMDLAGGATLERQILLARDEMFLLLADYVLDTSGGKICHRYRLPLDSTIEFEPEQETREGLLCAGKPIARIFPLALPEWRNDPRIGQLTVNNDRLQLEQEREGKNLACPLFIDLDKSRSKKACTWRQLTVAQSLEIQPHDVAVGYRIQCAKDQWLVYRSLADSANRTLLGQNLSSECLVARFLPPEGEVDELLEIE